MIVAACSNSLASFVHVTDAIHSLTITIFLFEAEVLKLDISTFRTSHGVLLTKQETERSK